MAKSESEAVAALRGYRNQFLYTLHWLLTSTAGAYSDVFHTTANPVRSRANSR
ncbi:MAG: hypothetical protein HY842_16420 [Bacteroidetes bacterium]|nr:hypothetical protein [Bacteroidota bacterium]